MTEPRAGRPSGSELLLLAAELAVVLLLIRSYRLEEDLGLLAILPVVFLGFLVHAWIPPAWRMPTFLMLSFAAIVLVLSPRQAMALIVLALGVFSVCHLPVAWGLRVAALALAGAALMAVRAEWLVVPWKSVPNIVLPVLGAMFMFRLVLYMIELRREKEPASLWQRLSYFFLLPNVVFLLFPIVDYRTFRRTYYDRPEIAIYERGVRLLFRGVLHLLAYRFVYHNLVLPAYMVGDLADVVQYVTSFWLLYMRISGQFHIVIGILCLFGFNLPETNHLYYLASSFTDLWRRTNIYWKDFMQNVFYFSFYTRLKRYGSTMAVAVATMGIFVVSWLLHSYQWLWLRGEFPIRLVDVLFWGIIGVAVMLTVLREMNRRARSTRRDFSVSRAARRSASTLGMFLAMSILWSLWSSRSIEEWTQVTSVAFARPAQEWVLLVAALLAAIAAGTVIQVLLVRGWWWSPVPMMASPRARAYGVVPALGLLILGQPGVQERVGGPVGAVAASFGNHGPNAFDVEREMLGYYEGLLDGETRGARAADDAPADWSELPTRPTSDLRRIELLPGVEREFKGATLRTNQWGFRDREYTREKPPDTYRIAVLGSSITMGAGVDNEETFEHLVEEALNADGGFRGFPRVELLNFGLSANSVLQEMRTLEVKVLPFEPDMVVSVVHVDEEGLARRALRASVAQQKDLGYSWLEEVVRRSGARAGLSHVRIERLLQPWMDDVLQGSMRTIAGIALENGIEPVMVYVPLTREDPVRSAPRRRTLLTWGARAGFRTLDVASAFEGHDPETLAIASWDYHPNERGHRLIADALLPLMRELSETAPEGTEPRQARGGE